MSMKWQAHGGENPLFSNDTLFSAALEEFAAHSFRDASLNSILRSAGMNKGSFYHRFNDKLDIYLSLINRMSAQKRAFMASHADEIASEGFDGGFFGGLQYQAALGLRFAKAHPSYNALWRRILTEEREVKDAIFNTFGKMTDDALKEPIEKAKSKGELREDISTDMAASLISTLLYRMDELISPEQGDEEILNKLAELFSLIGDGIKNKAEKEQSAKG